MVASIVIGFPTGISRLSTRNAVGTSELKNKTTFEMNSGEQTIPVKIQRFEYKIAKLTMCKMCKRAINNYLPTH
jgi:hypothetical protein